MQTLDALLLACVVLVVGCGGQIADPDAGPHRGNTSGTASSQAGEGGALPCPLLAPAPGDPCYSATDHVCAYVGGGLPCQAVQCDETGHWASTTDGCR